MTQDVYQVLARKYRPQTFEDLIGQDAMVRTLSNAFSTGRIAHAFMLTGVRGVGKTTTARLLARALNYRRDDKDAPQIDLSTLGDECEAITASRHPDVMEMDAASRTGVGDIREILDGVRYAPVRARYKVYVIDEVHMLSTSAFNALLKTLEEPPAHAKFIFATTEIRKVPVTVLSRCQRFDLKRAPLDTLVGHLASVCQQENVTVAEDALRLIARAAEGSVRDGLSILDQALVQGQTGKGKAPVSAEQVRDMLGLADRGRTFALFASAVQGEGAEAVAELAAQYDAGADPAVVMRDLLDHCHAVTRAKVLGEAAVFADAADHVAQVRALADAVSMGVLTRAWQMLLKAHEEVRAAPEPLAAAEMALLRLAYAAGLPSPEEAARLLTGAASPGGTAASPSAPPSATPAGAPVTAASVAAVPASGPAGGAATARAYDAAPEEDPDAWRSAVAEEDAPQPQPVASQPAQKAVIASWADVSALAEARRDLMLKSDLDRTARPVSVEPGRIVFQPMEAAPANLSARLSQALQDWTGERWLVSADARAQGGETLAEVREREKEALWADARADPLVVQALELWPGAEIVNVVETPHGDAADAATGAAPGNEDDTP